LKIKEFEAFQNDPSENNAMKLGQAITEAQGTIEEKKGLYSKIFKICDSQSDEKIHSIMNMWAVASMLEDQLPIPQKVQAVRGFIKDPHLTIELIEDWTLVVYKVHRVPTDMLDFIAIDIRNIKGISSELKEMLFER